MQELNLEFIKDKRTKLEISMQEMADRMGFKNASTYMKYENGTYAFKAHQLPVLASILKCKISDFFMLKVAKTAI